MNVSVKFIEDAPVELGSIGVGKWFQHDEGICAVLGHDKALLVNDSTVGKLDPQMMVHPIYAEWDAATMTLRFTRRTRRPKPLRECTGLVVTANGSGYYGHIINPGNPNWVRLSVPSADGEVTLLATTPAYELQPGDVVTITI